MKKLALTAALILTLGFAKTSEATVLTFDDTVSLDGYGGFEWTGFTLTEFSSSNKGVQGNIIDEYSFSDFNYVSIKRTDNKLFKFIDADFLPEPYETYNEEKIQIDENNYIINWSQTDLNYSIIGFINGVQIYPNNIFVDEIKILCSSGWASDQWGYSRSGYSIKPFKMDNFEYEFPVPEPTTMALGLMSMAGLFGARRKKNQ